mmetsp:Transcript_27491/g.38849  ORF Transcript_27491/g.38849 Transcript_27491/m.38849 type:complete len:116 (-) Transcript_27491:108-455(-)
MADKLETLTTTYFKVWNTRDGEAVGKLFSENGGLRDWDIEVKGREEVAKATAGIFTAVPKIAIDVLKQHVAVSSNSVAAEILVKLNDDKNTVLKVTDVIEYDDKGLIQNLRAYKG